MRTLALMVLVPTLSFAGAALATPFDPARQCRVGATETARPDQCKVQPAASDHGAPERYDWPQHHVMSKAEVRAELDAIRTERGSPSIDTARVALNDRPSADHE